MPAYLSRIAAAASASAGNRRGMSPSIRSRSPIAERDQRLTMMEAEWSLEGGVATDEASTETPAQFDPKARVKNESPPIQPPHVPSAPSAPIARAPSPRTDFPQIAPRMLQAESVAAHPSSDPVETHANGPSTFSEQRARGSQTPHTRSAERAIERAIPQTGENLPTLDLPVPSPVHADPPADFVGEIRSTMPARQVRAVPRVPDSADAAGEIRATALHISREVPPEWDTAMFSSRHEPAPAVAPAVVIDRIEVEVVPLPSEKPAAKPAPQPPARSGPVSQIGSLRGVPGHLAFSLRHH